MSFESSLDEEKPAEAEDDDSTRWALMVLGVSWTDG